MTYILAIDTSSDACSAAVLSPSGIVQKLSISPREHTQRLLPAIESLLAEQGMALSRMDAIAFSAGPGSFTGLRIGLSTAQGLAYGADLPLVAVSTLQAMAQTAVRLKEPADNTVIVPIIDARMDEVYWSAYEYQQGQLVQAYIEDNMCHPDNATDIPELTGNIDKAILGVGSGWQYSSLQSRFPDCFDQHFYPQAYDIAVIAQQHYQAGHIVSALEATPSYIRNEISWQKRQRIRSSSL